MKLLLATTNPNKIREIRAVLQVPGVELVTLADLPPIGEAEETGATYWQNAREKAATYARGSGLTAVAEDSGLEIPALGDIPGVHSARFIGPNVPYSRRFAEIYERLSALESPSRDARFVTAVAVAQPDGTILFECETAIEGEIAPRPAGAHGFGYDPIFLYRPFNKTTAELTNEEKAAVSHRARAFRDLARWLRSERPHIIAPGE
jgi:XTP/dITP diphosphohydrolase